MRLADVADVAVLEAAVFADAWSADAFRQEVLGGRHCFPYVAREPDSGALLGYMVSWLVADESHLGNLAVAPAARRRGVAQALVDRLLADAGSAECRLVTLEVRASNAAAQALYRKNGFYPVAVRRGYYSDNREDAVVMIKPLRESGRIPPLSPGDLPLPGPNDGTPA